MAEEHDVNLEIRTLSAGRHMERGSYRGGWLIDRRRALIQGRVLSC